MGRSRSILYEIDPESGCWVWQGATSWNEYGRVMRDGKLQWAHRWYYEQANGPIPFRKQLDHLCKNTKCVNPSHLEIVTRAENQRRGKGVRLDWDKVEFIRSNANTYSGRELSRMFGVAHGTIQNVLSYKSWQDEPVFVGGK